MDTQISYIGSAVRLPVRLFFFFLLSSIYVCAFEYYLYGHCFVCLSLCRFGRRLPVRLSVLLWSSTLVFICASLYLSFCVPVYLSFCLSVRLIIVCLYIRLFICFLFVCPSVYLSTYLTPRAFVCSSLHLFFCLAVFYLSVFYLSTSVFICLSPNLSV